MITFALSRTLFSLLILPVPLSFASAQEGQAAGRRQAQQSIHFEIGAAPEDVLPLFGPLRESEWSPSWNPRFIFPAAGSNTREGTIFSTSGRDGRNSVWILLEYSETRKLVRYAVVTPDDTATEIWVTVSPMPGKRSKVDVTERRTSLCPEADEFITRFEQHFPSEAGHWQEAMEACLKKAKK